MIRISGSAIRKAVVERRCAALRKLERGARWVVADAAASDTMSLSFLTGGGPARRTHLVRRAVLLRTQARLKP